MQNDQPTADSLQNSFVVQLSAKKIGLVVDGVTYGPVEILADHMTRRDAYGAILVDAGRYQFSNQGQPMTGWFLTIVPQTFPTRDAANQWCTDHGLGSTTASAARSSRSPDAPPHRHRPVRRARTACGADAAPPQCPHRRAHRVAARVHPGAVH